MKKTCIALAISIAALATPAMAASSILGPSPYLSAADSPFTGISGFSYFHLENLEDGAFNTPGATISGGSVIGPGGNVDNVDPVGRSYFGTLITVTFNAAILGNLPTHAGMAWTDGGNGVVFEAFDAAGSLFGSVTGNHADSRINGTTAEDRFYGAINTAGISKIRFNVASLTEADHFQYGYLKAAPTPGVPEPAAWAMMITGFGLVGGAMRTKGGQWRRFVRPALS